MKKSMGYSLDFRKKVLQVKKQERLTLGETAQRFLIGISTLCRWEKRIEPKTSRQKAPTKIHTEVLLMDVALYPDAYQYERAQRLGVSESGIGSALKRLKISRKKKSNSSQS